MLPLLKTRVLLKVVAVIILVSITQNTCRFGHYFTLIAEFAAFKELVIFTSIVRTLLSF